MKKKIKTKTVRVTDFVKSRPIVRLVKVAACFMITVTSHAASIVWMESGTDATGDLTFYSNISGTVATDATVSHTGPRSVKFSTMNPAVNAIATSPTATLSDAGNRISFWFKTDTAGNGSFPNFFTIVDSSNLGVCSFHLTSASKVYNNPAGATPSTGVKTIEVNKWYRITIAFTISNTTTFKFVVFVDGVLDSTAISGTLTRVGASKLRPNALTAFGINANVWFDDFYVDNGSDYTDPGNILVTAKKPAGNNVNQYDTAVGNNPANRWENVNEVPLSIANGWQQLAIADTQENYTLQTRAAGDVDISAFPIVGRLAWIWAKETAVLGTPKIMDNGTESAIVLTTSPALYTIVSTDGVYPSNAAGIGMRSAVTAAGTFLYECGTLIAYTAPVTPNAMMSFFFK